MTAAATDVHEQRRLYPQLCLSGCFRQPNYHSGQIRRLFPESTYGSTYKFVGYAYTYDNAGNILTSTDNLNNVTTYTYDDQNQLLTESGTVSGFNGPPVSYNNTYTYDTTGNILTSSDGETTHTYTYGDAEWKDLLTAYDGESITYDAIGNPTSYYNGNRWTMGWENGRQLTTLSKQPPVVISTQPENYYGTVGGTASFTVAASGDRVTYQWQCSTDDGETWSNISGGTSTTLNVPIQASVNGNLYRCIAKDYMGHAATSQAGKLTVTSSVATYSEFDPEFTLINEPDDSLWQTRRYRYLHRGSGRCKPELSVAVPRSRLQKF